MQREMWSTWRRCWSDSLFIREAVDRNISRDTLSDVSAAQRDYSRRYTPDGSSFPAHIHRLTTLRRAELCHVFLLLVFSSVNKFLSALYTVNCPIFFAQTQ